MENKTKYAIGIIIIIILIVLIGFLNYSYNAADERDFGDFSLNIPTSYEFVNTTFDYGYALSDEEHEILITYIDLNDLMESVNGITGTDIQALGNFNFAEFYTDFLGEYSQELEDNNPNDNITYYNATNLAQTLSNVNGTEDYAAVYTSNSTIIIIETTDLNHVRELAESLKVNS